MQLFPDIQFLSGITHVHKCVSYFALTACGELLFFLISSGYFQAPQTGKIRGPATAVII